MIEHDQNWWEDFASKHPEPVTDGNWLLFGDGARQERSAHGLRQLPPDNPKLLREILVRYWGIRIDILASAFKHKKLELQQAARGGVVAPSDADVIELEAMQQAVLAAQEHADALYEDEEVEFEREYERAVQIDRQLNRLRAKRKKAVAKAEEARLAGKSSAKFAEEAAVLRKEINELSREWRNVDGPARHRLQTEHRELICSHIDDRLNGIEI